MKWRVRRVLLGHVARRRVGSCSRRFRSHLLWARLRSHAAAVGLDASVGSPFHKQSVCVTRYIAHARHGHQYGGGMDRHLWDSNHSNHICINANTAVGEASTPSERHDY